MKTHLVTIEISNNEIGALGDSEFTHHYYRKEKGTKDFYDPQTGQGKKRHIFQR